MILIKKLPKIDWLC